MVQVCGMVVSAGVGAHEPLEPGSHHPDTTHRLLPTEDAHGPARRRIPDERLKNWQNWQNYNLGLGCT